MSLDALTAILLIPAVSAALLAALPGYRLTAQLNVAAALATHAGLEDELLFTALDQRGDAPGGPMAVMRMEHAEIEDSLASVARTRDLDRIANQQHRLWRITIERGGKQMSVVLGG